MCLTCAVIKPIFGAASMGVVRVNDQAQLDSAYERVQKEMSSARIEAGALVQGHPSEDGVRSFPSSAFCFTNAVACEQNQAWRLLRAPNTVRCSHKLAQM